MMEGTRKNEQTESTTVLSPGIKESAQSFQIDNSVTNLENIKMFTKTILLNKKAISEIEKATQNQSENKVWFEQRYGRITASNLHNVVSRLKFEKEEPLSLIHI